MLRVIRNMVNTSAVNLPLYSKQVPRLTPFYFVSLVTPSGAFDDNGYKPENIIRITARSRSHLRFFVIYDRVEYIRKINKNVP